MRTIACLHLTLALLVPAGASAAIPPHGAPAARELAVHVAQANNDGPYVFVRAKFEPGEVADPWAVRFFDRQGKQLPYFIWDSVTWKTARAGRPDWGNRFPLLNHYAGASPDAQKIRAHRIARAKQQFPELGAKLAAREEAAWKSEDSVCAVLYLVRYRVPPFGKEKLTLRLYPTRQIQPRQRTLRGDRVEQRTTIASGGLRFERLPDELTVSWKGREFFRCAGVSLGDSARGKHQPVSARFSHADPTRPFSISITEGLITRLLIQGQTRSREDDAADWQCTYWLFPEGGYVALEGFSLHRAEGYRGGDLSLSILQAPAAFQPVHAPLWEKPWWLHQAGAARFVATHQFADTPLTVGHGNNPFSVGQVNSFSLRNDGGQLGLTWSYDLSSPETLRLFHPRIDDPPSLEIITALAGRLRDPAKTIDVPARFVSKEVGSRPLTQEERRYFDEALDFARWQPRVDWLYRQYLVGVGETASAAEAAMRPMLGAAVGWIDRPIPEAEIAELLAQGNLRFVQKTTPTPNSSVGVWQVLPALARGDREAVRQVLAASRDPKEMIEDAMQRIQRQIASGGDPLQGSSKEGGEGWIVNPAYVAAQAPAEFRFLEQYGLFDLTRYPKSVYEEALLRWADYSLELMGGRPLDMQKLRASYRSLTLNRVLMIAPLMLRTYRMTRDERYAKAARLIFDEIMEQVESNPRGYTYAWGRSPKAEMFDTNYNPAMFERGITDFWTEQQLDLIGRDRAAGFAAAQARYLVFSGQLLDTFEAPRLTAIHNDGHGRPNTIAQFEQFLYDDYLFYRGLVAEPIRWAVIDDGAEVLHRLGRLNFYAVKSNRLNLFWAFGFGHDTPSRTAREIRARWSAGGE